MSDNTTTRAVFLDCNGVMSEERENYIRTPEDFVFLPGAPEAIAELTRNGYPIIIVSNQAGVGRGLYTRDALSKIHQKMMQALTDAGGRITKTYYCIHYPECPYRKPNPGMFQDAAQTLGIDLAQSYMIGDRDSDLKPAKELGCTTFFVRTGWGAGYETKAKPWTDHAVVDLRQAVQMIVRTKGHNTLPPSTEPTFV